MRIIPYYTVTHKFKSRILTLHYRTLNVLTVYLSFLYRLFIVKFKTFFIYSFLKSKYAHLFMYILYETIHNVLLLLF